MNNVVNNRNGKIATIPRFRNMELTSFDPFNGFNHAITTKNKLIAIAVNKVAYSSAKGTISETIRMRRPDRTAIIPAATMLNNKLLILVILNNQMSKLNPKDNHKKK